MKPSRLGESPRQPRRLDDRAHRVVPADLDGHHLGQAADRAVPHPAQPSGRGASPSSTTGSSWTDTPFLKYFAQFGDPLDLDDRCSSSSSACSAPTAWPASPIRAASGWRCLVLVHLPAAVGRADHPALSDDGEGRDSPTRSSAWSIAYTTFALPYALWLLRSFMAGIPEDLECGRAGRRRQPHGRLRRRDPAAGAARHHLDRALHLHPGLERISLCAGAGEHRRGPRR